MSVRNLFLLCVELCKAEDDDSIATLSADEGADHRPQDDESCVPLEDASPPQLPSFPTQVSTTTEHPLQNKGLTANQILSCRSDLSPDGYLSRPSQHDAEAVLHKSRHGKDGSRHERVSLATSSPLLASEMRGFVRPGSEFEDRSKGMPDLLPLGRGARGTSPQVYSPPVGSQSVGDSRAVLPIAGMSSFVRNSGSPARIRDLIHAAIKKTLQVSDRKPSEAEVNAKRHGEWKTDGGLRSQQDEVESQYVKGQM